MDDLLKQAEVAVLARVSVRTVEGWRAHRKGPPFVKVGGQVRYSKEAVLRWLGKDPDDIRF
jgi:excisionase family DNA binding protein